MARRSRTYASVEVCAGAGGQAVGLEAAGFEHLALVEIDPHACETMRRNRPKWNVVQRDLHHFIPWEHLGPGVVDLLAGGVPCPPFSMAGKQLGRDDDRDLFPVILGLAETIRPRVLMIENVRGLLQAKFDAYRAEVTARLERLGYRWDWRLLQARDYGVAQLRPRSVLIAARPEIFRCFAWPHPHPGDTPTVGEVLRKSMSSRGWEGARDWAAAADRIAPTLVGGSKKHGGADLGPTRAKRAWREMGVDALGVADEVPGPGFRGLPRLTVAQAALLQGFPPDWVIPGRKTAAYRQVGNAFPPPVAEAVGRSIASALAQADRAAPARPPGDPARAGTVTGLADAPGGTGPPGPPGVAGLAASA
jgi:DNA (cytosine-5)-methyltransferase 1